MKTLKRFGSLLTNWKFCQEILWTEKTLKPTWKFWFTWNFVLVIILSGATFLAFKIASPQLQKQLDLVLPDFEVHIQEGKLKTSLEDPKIFSTEKEIIILDTKKVAYTPEVLADYDYGLFVTETDLTLTAKEEGARMVFQFSDFEDQSWSKKNLLDYWSKNDLKYLGIFSLLLIVFLSFLLAGIGLIFCLLGALLSWGIGVIFRLEDWPFYKNLGAWMHYVVLFSYLQIIFTLWGLPPVISIVLCLGLLGVGLYQTGMSQRAKA